jgi:hypothetical protein
MAMNYTEANTLMTNSWFRDRVRVSTSTYANYLLNTDAEDPEYDQKINAATRLANQSEMVVNTLMFTLCGDAEVQLAGPAIPDAQLQAIVEKTILKFWPIQPAPPVTFGMSPNMYPPPPPPRAQ